MRAVALAGGALVLALAAVTGFALESGGVGVVETSAAEGELRRTHVWPVEIDGELWLEAGTPDNGWYVDLGREAVLWLERDGIRRRYRAVPVPTEPARRRVRAGLRERFGWRDAWVGLFVDSSRSVAVRLEGLPADPGTPDAADAASRVP